MSDPMNTLRHLDEGLPVHPLPASEVRRRGDRLRHRRTAFQALGAAAAVAALATAGVLLGGGTPRTLPVPGPASQAPTTPATYPATTVPPGFPLGAGLRLEPVATPSTSTPGAALRSPLLLDPCAGGSRSATERGRTDLQQLMDQVAGTHWWRQVVVYDSAASARAAFAGLAAAVDRCPTTPRSGSGAVLHWTRLDAALPGADSSMTTVAHVTSAGRPTVQAVHVLVARVGSAMVLLRTHGALAGSESSLDAVDFDQRRNAERMVAAMCVFTPDGCGGRPRLSATGYGDLRLGMSAAQAAASADVEDLDKDTGGACRLGRLTDGGTFYLSRRLGVAGIMLGGVMQTDRGVMLGSGEAEVRRAYPGGAFDAHGYWTVPLPGGARLQVAMPHGVAEEVDLSLPNQDCFG